MNGCHRFVVGYLMLAVFWTASIAPAQSTSEDWYQRAAGRLKNNEPFGRALADLAKALDAGLERPSRVLVDDDWNAVRNNAEARKALRELLEDHARESEIGMTVASEAGRPLDLEMEFVDRKSGKPLAECRVYLYHTDDAGDYAPDAENPGGGSDNPRLFGFARTDAEGRVRVRTILPGPYRGTQITRHVHLGIVRPDQTSFGTAIYFDTDPGLDDELRQENADGRVAIAKLESNGERESAKVVFRVPSR